MRVRYKETDRAADVEFRRDEETGEMILVGRGNLFYIELPQDDDDQEWYADADTFHEDFELVQATADERVRLIDAGFRIDRADIPIVIGDTPV